MTGRPWEEIAQVEGAPMARRELSFSLMAYYLACAVASIFMAIALSATVALEFQSGWGLAFLPGMLLLGMLGLPVTAFLFLPAVALSVAIAGRCSLYDYRHHAALGALAAAGTLGVLTLLLACVGMLPPVPDNMRLTLLVLAEFVMSGLVAGVVYSWLASSFGRKHESAN